MIRTVAAWALAIVSIGIYVVVPILDPGTNPGAVLFLGAATASFVIVGLLLVGRAPGNRIGPLLVLTGVLLAAAFALSSYALIGVTASPHWPAIAVAAVVSDALILYPIVLALIGIPLVFPDGRLISPRWRWVVVLVVVAMTAQTIQFFIDPDQAGPGAIDNPFGNPDLEGLAEFLGGFSAATSVIGFGAAAAALWVRFRRGDPIERQQLKWLVAVVALAAIFFPVAFIAPAAWANEAFFFLGIMTMIAFPIAIAVAILRYHLFEIDRLISRTIAYLLITAVLVAAYVGLVIVIGGPIAEQTGRDTISVALSTLIVAALFQPVRRRIQRLVDRRFDRARIDADRTTAAFSERLRDEVDIETLTGDLRETVHAAVRPDRLGVWLREDGR